MIVDTSVLICFLREEPETPRFLSILLGKKGRLKMSAASYLEAGIKIDSLRDDVLSERLDRLVAFFDIDIVPVTRDQTKVARYAYRRFGKGHHPAKLNYGDCFAYALAKTEAAPLLFKGDDFPQTDVQVASRP
ncbi:type II toxin-antitoxin system VapC family toxin [Sphingomonas sp.]|uniref:type II toxin-antitoxin system VapC family toxin n=1 Tax=Sphingomonas sp. TaxID=28214 RepID=UPI003342C29B